MAHTAYTVDRRGALRPGITIELVRHSDVQPAPLQEYVNDWFPNGVSEHGESYLLRPAPATLLDPIVELACELVRRADFPDLPSRFTSVFGCATLEDAQTFRSQFGPPGAPIFEVETNCMPLRVDMRCLDIRSSIPGHSLRCSPLLVAPS